MYDINKMVEIELKEPDDFLKVKETLTRIGIASKKTKTLFQSCHILHKKGRYYICHFKEMFALDGKFTEITDNDLGRRNTIANLLQEWDLIRIINPHITDEPAVPISQIKILSYKEKNEYILITKYNIGKSKF